MAGISDRKAALADPRFAETFLFDALVFNTDRHLGNFGYLVDNDKNEIIGPAPIFDNGYGLFSLMTLPERVAADDFTSIQAYLRGKHPALFDRWLDFPSIATLNLRACAEKLRGFRFHRHNHYNLPDGRIALIERFLQKRVSDILLDFDKADDLLQATKNSVGVNSKNLNGNVGAKTENDENLKTLDGDALALQILWNLKANPLMTQSELANVLGRETRTVERKVRKLRDARLLRRVGSDKSGSWDVVSE